MPQYLNVQPRFSPRPADPAAVGIKAPPLRYRIEPTGSTQSRFDGRLLLAPELDLGRYTCRAEIDWLWLEFETKRRTGSTNLRTHLKDLLGETHAVFEGGARHNDRPGWNEVGTRFRMKVQDPAPEAMSRLTGVIDGFCGLAGPIRIIGIEIALDWKPNDGTDAARWLMVAALHRHHLPMIDGLESPDADLRYVYQNPDAKPGRRQKTVTGFVIQDRRPDALTAGSEREGSDLDLATPMVRKRVLRADGHLTPFIDSTVYRGAGAGEVLFRIQNKIVDQRDPETGKGTELAPGKRRARVEVRLLGGAVAAGGFGELDGLFDFDFKRLRKPYFPFWLATIPGGGKRGGQAARPGEHILALTLRRVFAQSGVYGADLYETARAAEDRANREMRQDAGEKLDRAPRTSPTKHRQLCAWNEMTKRTGRALELLGKRWSRVAAEIEQQPGEAPLVADSPSRGNTAEGEGEGSAATCCTRVPREFTAARPIESNVDSPGGDTGRTVQQANSVDPEEEATDVRLLSGIQAGNMAVDGETVIPLETRAGESSKGGGDVLERGGGSRREKQQDVDSHESRTERHSAARRASDAAPLALQGEKGQSGTEGVRPATGAARGRIMSWLTDLICQERGFWTQVFRGRWRLHVARLVGRQCRAGAVAEEVRAREADDVAA